MRCLLSTVLLSSLALFTNTCFANSPSSVIDSLWLQETTSRLLAPSNNGTEEVRQNKTQKRFETSPQSVVITKQIDQTKAGIRAQQRELYLQAIKALDQNKRKQFHQLAEQLKDYPLLPYLELKAIESKLSYHSRPQVERFLSHYHDQYPARLLRKSWLSYLEKNGFWRDILVIDSQNSAHITNRCRRLEAMLNSPTAVPIPLNPGIDHIAQQIEQLWLSGNSLPQQCDQTLSHWEKLGYRSNRLIWQRLALAFDNNNLKLATYLVKQLNPAQTNTSSDPAFIQEARTLLATAREPERFEQLSTNPLISDAQKSALNYAILRLAKRNPKQAIKLSAQHRNTLDLSGPALSSLHYKIALGLSSSSYEEAINWLISIDPESKQEKLLELRLLFAVRNENWQELNRWIPLLSHHKQKTAKWQYWRARSQSISGKQPPLKSLQSDTILRKLAQQRNYYGFLAADLISSEYTFNDESKPPSDHDQWQQNPLLERHGIVRAIELEAIGESISARREWYYESASFSEQEWQLAGSLAHSIGWHPQAIAAMAEAKSWNDLSIRFPLPYRQNFSAEARRQELDVNWLFAIARQESGFASDARSRVGALGLLQLMPRTARQTATIMGLSYRKHRLLHPEYNIKLGASYLATLNRKFSGNRVLATAAYNAGPHRVKRWVARHGTDAPLDIWVEKIPYKETREYVQRVLAYTVIYGYRQGIPSTIHDISDWSSDTG